MKKKKTEVSLTKKGCSPREKQTKDRHRHAQDFVDVSGRGRERATDIIYEVIEKRGKATRQKRRHRGTKSYKSREAPRGRWISDGAWVEKDSHGGAQSLW